MTNNWRDIAEKTKTVITIEEYYMLPAREMDSMTIDEKLRFYAEVRGQPRYTISYDPTLQNYFIQIKTVVNEPSNP